MLEIEKKRAEQIDAKMNISINLETGQSTLKIDERDNEFSFAAQNKAVNEFMQENLSIESRGKGMFRPFEADGNSKQVKITDMVTQMMNLSTFNIKAASLKDKKDQNLYKSLSTG